MEKDIRLNFKALFRIIWDEKLTIILIGAAITACGIAYALLAREEFETHGKILPEIQGKNAMGLNQFAGLASLAGVDLNSLGGSGIDAVRPDLYPDVLSSTPFYLELFKAEVTTKENNKLTFEEFYHQFVENGTDPDEEMIKKYDIEENGVILINQLDEKRLKDLRKRIVSGIDRKSGVITIYCKLPDPVVAAETAKFAMDYLMEYVKAYRTEKLIKDVEYLEDQVRNSRSKYYANQESKAVYTDQFRDMRLQGADVKRERIESEYRLSANFYNELLKKLEEAKFRLHQETPVFKVLEPPIVPAKKSEPKRTIITLMTMVFGGVVALLVALMKNKNYRRMVIRA